MWAKHFCSILFCFVWLDDFLFQNRKIIRFCFGIISRMSNFSGIDFSQFFSNSRKVFPHFISNEKIFFKTKINSKKIGIFIQENKWKIIIQKFREKKFYLSKKIFITKIFACISLMKYNNSHRISNTNIVGWFWCNTKT